MGYFNPDPHKNWLMCDHHRGETPCLYSQASLRRMKGDPPRCIRHGNILDWAPSLNGMTREQIKAQWKAEDEKSNR